MSNRRNIKVVKVVIMVIAAIFFFGFLVLKLWNWLMPEIFGLPHISFFQAIGLLALSKILFTGFKGGPGADAKARLNGVFFKKTWEKKLSNLNPEEREKLKNECKINWGKWCDSTEEIHLDQEINK